MTYDDRRWERCMLAAILGTSAVCWVAIVGLFGVHGVLVVLGTGVLLAAAFARGVGA